MAGRSSKKSGLEKKCCPKCGRALPLSKFYPHKAWKEQIFHDLWCKDCIERECTDEESLKTYFYENDRAWSEPLYEAAVRKAKKSLMANPSYVGNRSLRDREVIEQRTIVNAVLSMMNLANFYKYVDNGIVNPISTPVDVAKEDEQRKQMSYSKCWRGYYTPDEIDTLEEIYDQYDRDFDLSDVSMQDYAIKVVKASFNADQVYDRMRRGEASGSDYKDALKSFDDLSKSSNFAACRRKPGENTGMGSLGEIILRIEGTGKLNIEGDVWPKDSVDAAIADYYHVVEALGREGGI